LRGTGERWVPAIPSRRDVLLVGLRRIVERRRAVPLARHFRVAEGLSIAQIADRLGRSPATVKAYFYDPTGEKARTVKARYVGVCRGCGAYTQPRNSKRDAYRYCKRCRPRRSSGSGRGSWCLGRCGLDGQLRESSVLLRLVSHANRWRGVALTRLKVRDWPPASVRSNLFGDWQRAREAARAAAR
jgi:AraC-like DNA-binding protein